MRRAPKRSTLVHQYTRWLVALFIALELVTASAVILFIFMPIARRAADDLAGLMVLSAQTWVELPPETRPVFEDELARGYQIALRPSLQAAPDTGLRHGLYIRFLENAFERRLGHEAFFEKEIAADGSDWLWIAIPTGGRSIGAGFAMDRMEANPFYAFAVALVIGTLLVLVLARWLASRIAHPISKFELAAAQLGTAAGPDLLPETGPRELADLAHHFNQMAIQVRELSDARTTLFAGLSHDLRTPLARMRLALEILTLKPDPALLLRLDADIEEMDQLIGQLLEIARGLSTEPAQDLALCQWLQARTLEHHAAAAASGTQLIVNCADDLRVHAAPRMLARVLDNLIVNALRYAPGTVEVVGHVLPPTAGRQATLRIGVLDRGPGIPNEQLASAFRPFHRIEGAASSRASGFGLGLAIVQQLARANGWTIRLEAREGGGLQAWIELPLAL